MRRNNFLKYIIMSGGSGQNRAELESQTLPYTFTSNGHRVRNYRIYGAEDGVGDLDSTTGKYILSIKINSQTVSISLDTPLYDGDYLDFHEQKRFNSDSTTENISLPAILTLNGINVLNVNTENQPSKIWLQGNISAFNVSSWASVQQLVRAGLHDKYFAVGDQLVCQKGNTNITWDIIGFDHDTPVDQQFTHSMTLQLHDCLPSTMQYDAPEALYYAENGLAAGTYNFTIQDDYDTEHGGGKTYQFTLSNDVPVGGQLTFGWSLNAQAADSKITSYASASSTTPIEQVSVIEGNSGTSLGTTDGNSININHIYRVRFGNDNPAQSALRQFLNSDSVAGSVWTPQNIYDRPPTWNADTAGFMSDLDSDFLAVIGAVHKVTCLNTVTDGGGSVTLDDNFFLLSRSEVYGGKEVNSVDEGEPYPYYSDYSDLSAAGTGNDSNRIKYISNTAQIWYLRTPVSSANYRVRYVTATGAVNYNRASNSYAVAPACNII